MPGGHARNVARPCILEDPDLARITISADATDHVVNCRSFEGGRAQQPREPGSDVRQAPYWTRPRTGRAP